ncbi:hypothetical protein ACFL51_02070 [Myxococcota bacterium]
MSIDNLTFRLPRYWTPEQAEFLSAVLEDLTQAIWETYEDDLMRLWRDRDGLRFPGDNQPDPQQQQPAAPPPHPEPLCAAEEEIPW